MTARGDLKSPGEMLQQAREDRGLSLAEMSEKTKIPPRLLAAIEVDDYQKVAEPLYVKSFLQTYALCLELDAQDIIDRYNRRAETFVPNPEGEQIWEEEVQVRRVGLGSGGRLLRWGGALAVLAVLVVLIGRGLWRQEKQALPGSLAGGATETVQSDVGPVQPADPAATAPAARSTDPDNSSPIVDPRADSEEVLSPPGNLAETTQAVIPSWTETMRLAAAQLDSLALLWESVPGNAAATPSEKMSLAAGQLRPSALRGDGSLIFAGGRQWPLVLRILTTDVVAISVKADGQARLVPVRWPPGETETLPARDIEPGRVYAVAQGYAMYWGARDHFYLLLSSREAVQVSLNGITQTIPERNVGREWMLDTDALGGRDSE